MTLVALEFIENLDGEKVNKTLFKKKWLDFCLILGFTFPFYGLKK